MDLSWSSQLIEFFYVFKGVCLAWAQSNIGHVVRYEWNIFLLGSEKCRFEVWVYVG